MKMATENSGETAVPIVTAATKRAKIVDDNDEPRFLLQGCEFDSYQDLVFLIARIVKSRNKTFPPEIMRNIANFFTTKRLNPSRTRALRCSSTTAQHSLDQCLVDTENSWWISADGSLRNGRFQFNQSFCCLLVDTQVFSLFHCHNPFVDVILQGEGKNMSNLN